MSTKQIKGLMGKLLLITLFALTTSIARADVNDWCSTKILRYGLGWPAPCSLCAGTLTTSEQCWDAGANKWSNITQCNTVGVPTSCLK